MENMDAFERQFMTPAELAAQDRLDAQQRSFKADWYDFGSELGCGSSAYATLVSIGSIITELTTNSPELHETVADIATASGVTGIVLGGAAAVMRWRANRLRGL